MYGMLAAGLWFCSDVIQKYWYLWILVDWQSSAVKSSLYVKFCRMFQIVTHSDTLIKNCLTLRWDGGKNCHAPVFPYHLPCTYQHNPINETPKMFTTHSITMWSNGNTGCHILHDIPTYHHSSIVIFKDLRCQTLKKKSLLPDDYGGM